MDTDRNLLFGVLALQADVITSTQFIEGCTLWANRKDVPLADLMAERGWLTPEDVAHVNYLLGRKLHKHGGDARASLAEAAPTPLRRSLAALHDADVQQSLAGLPLDNGRAVSATVAYEPQGRDRYLLTQLHAQGGIGQVWLAHDTDVGRDVALKELRPEREDQPAIRARFLEEGRVTGQLEHPGIVPVYELARDREGGRPFYTMRFIKGRTLGEAIKTYHRRREAQEAGPLELRELLTSFVGVCQAVAYAHSRRVLHRDLKPQNIVLGDFGEVIVLDWGLAKLLDKAEDAASLVPVAAAPQGSRDQTMQGQVLGTPAYMAPEQAQGRLDLLDQRSDVYGLGAILYEILTGGPPFTGEDTQSVLRQVIHEPPVLPRQRVAATPLALEALCLKALAKKPEDRYASVKELATEVQRWLADEPVAVYREPLATRLARWGRRHRTLVTGAAALLQTAVVALAVGLMLLSRANAHIEQQRQRADAAFRQAHQAVDDYLTAVSEEQLLNEPGQQRLREKLLRSALTYYEDFVNQHGDDPELRRELANAHLRWGSILADIGSRDEKGEAQGALHEAIAMFKQLEQDEPARRGLARSYHTLASVQIFGNQPAEGEKMAKRATEMLEKLRDEHPEVNEYGRLLGRSYDLIAASLGAQGRAAEVEPFSLKAIATLDEVVRRGPSDIEAQRFRALAHNNLGVACRELERFDEEKAHVGLAIGLYRRLVKERPTFAHFSSDLARTLTNLGRNQSEQVRWTAAEGPLSEADHILYELARESPDVPLYAALRGTALGVLGRTKVGQRRHTAQAMKVLRDAITLFERLQAEGKLHDFNIDNLADAHFQLGVAQAEGGRADEGSRECEKAVQLLKPLVVKNLNRRYQGNLALYEERFDLLRAESRRKTAAEQIAGQERAIQLLDGVVRADPSYTTWKAFRGTAHVRLADLYRNAGKPAEALSHLKTARTILEEAAGKQPTNLDYRSRLAAAWAAHGRLQGEQGETAPALRSAEKAVALADELAREEPSYLYDLACYRALLSTLHDPKGKEAVQIVATAVDALSKVVAAGYDNVHKLNTDTHLAPIRTRPEFQNVLKQAEANAKAARQ